MARLRRAPLLLLMLVALAVLPWTGARLGVAEEEEEERRSILSLIAPRSGEVIADVGCGTGTWTFPLARGVGMHGRIYAVDIDAGPLDVVRERVKSEGVENVTVIHSMPDDPMLKADSLDAVFLNDVIDYVDRAAQAGFLDGIRTALKPAGRLIIRDSAGNPDRVIAECYRAGFRVVEAKIPLMDVPTRAFSSDRYALKLRRADEPQPAILPRLDKPLRYRTRLHLAEELFRGGLISREELRSLWEAIQNTPGEFDPDVDEARDLIRAAQAAGVLDEKKAEEIRKRAIER